MPLENAPVVSINTKSMKRANAKNASKLNLKSQQNQQNHQSHKNHKSLRTTVHNTVSLTKRVKSTTIGSKNALKFVSSAKKAINLKMVSVSHVMVVKISPSILFATNGTNMENVVAVLLEFS